MKNNLFSSLFINKNYSPNLCRNIYVRYMSVIKLYNDLQHIFTKTSDSMPKLYNTFLVYKK